MDTSLEELQGRFGSAVSAGQGGLPRVRVGAGEIYLHGAQVTSWQPAGFEEVLFVSRQASWAAGRAIRGGIPVCFPWFRERADDAKAPQHGFVRTKAWELDAVDAGEVTLSTRSDPGTQAWWPYSFTLKLHVSFGTQLVQKLTMRNEGATELRFEEALHTYYRVGAADRVRVRGLEDVEYSDNMDGNRMKRQQGEIVFAAQTDRAYLNTVHAVEIEDPVLRRRIRIEKENSRTTVVWNPWSTGAKSMADLGDEDWRSMVCVEASNIRAFGVVLGPGAEHVMKTVVTVSGASVP